MNDRYSEQLRTFAHLSEAIGQRFDARLLMSRRATVVVGDGVLESDAGQVLALTVARLLPRICPRISLKDLNIAPSSD